MPSELEMRPIRSSNVSLVGYDADTQTLFVTFASGAEYAYDGVPPGVERAIIDAASPGKFFAENVRNVYSARRV